LVDDDHDIVHIFNKGLTGKFKVDAFSDSQQALDHFRRQANQYDLVLTDVRMPKVSGFELAKEVRRIRPDITILFMTAFAIIPDEYKQVFPPADSSYFIEKPISIRKLEQIVTECLSPR
jgi:DNA-binding NtrC family response regulator